MTLKNSKAKGSRREHQTMRLLEAAGYRCCRSAASLGAWDVVGCSGTDWVVVQVKSNDWPRSGEMAEMQEFKVPPGTKKLIHRWRDGKRAPDVREID